MNADELARILDELGRRIHPAGEYVFGLAVRQVYAESVIWSITSGVALVALTVALTVALRLARRHWVAETKRYEEGKGRPYSDGPDVADYLFAFGIGSIIWLPAFGYAAHTLITNLIRLANPEYAALRDLIGTIVR